MKSEGQQARGMLFRTRDLLVRQRTQTINALRGHLAEFGVVAPQGPAHVSPLASALEDPGSGLPELVRVLGGLLLEQIAGLNAKIVGLEKELRACARRDEEASRLMTIPSTRRWKRPSSKPATIPTGSPSTKPVKHSSRPWPRAWMPTPRAIPRSPFPTVSLVSP